MLTRLIVDLYGWIIEVYLWFILLISGVAGYHYTVPMLRSAGLILEDPTPWKILGAPLFAVATFLVSAVFLGPVLVLVDIRKSVRAFEAKNSGSGSSRRDIPAERREPF